MGRFKVRLANLIVHLYGPMGFGLQYVPIAQQVVRKAGVRCLSDVARCGDVHAPRVLAGLVACTRVSRGWCLAGLFHRADAASVRPSAEP
jgi:hypothetical protein